MKKNGFPERLKVLIQQKGLTLVQIAQGIGTTPPSVHRWTKGGEIEYENLLALSNFLEVNWIWLRYGDEAIRSAAGANPESQTESDLRREYLDQILENEIRMKTALEMAQIVNWEWNALTGTFAFSTNAEMVFATTPDSIKEKIAPFSTLPLEELLQLFAGKQFHLWDFNLDIQGIGSRWFASRAKLILDPQNVPTKVIGVTENITERKLAEFALERSEYTLRKIIETIPVGLWVANEKGVITLANPEVIRIWGGAKYVGLEQYGLYKGTWEKNGQSLTNEDWTLARAVMTGEASQAEVVNIEAFDGAHRSINMFAIPLLDNDEKIIGAIEVNQDITDIKLTERKLQKSHNRLQLIYEQSSFGVLDFNDNGIQRINDKLSVLLKIKAETKNKLTLNQLFSEETVQKIAQIKERNETGEITGVLLVDSEDGKNIIKAKIYLIGLKNENSMLLVFPE